MPLLTFTATHVTNDAFAIPIGALVILFALRREPAAFAIALGAALLTKAYFLVLLPPVAVILFAREFRRTAAAGLMGAIVIAGWWYWLTWKTTGSLSGNTLFVNSTGGAWRKIADVPWDQAIHYGWMTFVWTGNWSFLVVRTWMYRVLADVCLFALGGLAYRIWKRDHRVTLLSAFTLSFACGIAYFSLVAFAKFGFPGGSAWYACCLAAPIAVLLFAGLETIAPHPIKPASGPILVILFSALELFGTNMLMLPYYGGLISHLPNGGLPACRLGQLISGSRTMMERLTLYKPAWLTASALLTLWGLYFAATVALAVISVYVAVRSRRLSQE